MLERVLTLSLIALLSGTVHAAKSAPLKGFEKENWTATDCRLSIEDMALIKSIAEKSPESRELRVLPGSMTRPKVRVDRPSAVARAERAKGEARMALQKAENEIASLTIEQLIVKAQANPRFASCILTFKSEEALEYFERANPHVARAKRNRKEQNSMPLIDALGLKNVVMYSKEDKREAIFWEPTPEQLFEEGGGYWVGSSATRILNAVLDYTTSKMREAAAFEEDLQLRSGEVREDGRVTGYYVSSTIVQMPVLKKRPSELVPEADKKNMLFDDQSLDVAEIESESSSGANHRHGSATFEVGTTAREQALKAPMPEDVYKNMSREEILSLSARLPIENAYVVGSVSLKGGQIDDWSLKNYFTTLEKTEAVHVLSPRGAPFARGVDMGWVASDPSLAMPDGETLWTSQNPGESLAPGRDVTLSWTSPQGIRFERVFLIDDHYMLTITQRVVNTGTALVSLAPYARVTQTGLPDGFQHRWILHEGPIGFVGDELFQKTYKDLQKEGQASKSGTGGWSGITDKYWLVAFAPDPKAPTTYRYSYVPDLVSPERARYQADYTGAVISLAPGAQNENIVRVFIGAKKVILLEEYQEKLGIQNFELAVDFGTFYFLTKPFFFILHFFGEATGNLGIAILILTFIIRMAVFPLTNLSYRSFAKMKKVAPQINALREKCGDDRAQLQKEIVELYQREGVNPLAGCFPILLQIPIFFALYKVFFTTIEIRHQPFFGWIKDLSAPDPTSIFNLFGLLPIDLPPFLHVGVWPCLMLVGMLIQKRLNPPPQDKIQRDMMNFFPFIMTFIMASFAAGLVIYWTFSAFLSIAQQIFIMRSLSVPIHLFGEEEEKPAVATAPLSSNEALQEVAPKDVAPVEGITPPKKRRKKKKSS